MVCTDWVIDSGCMFGVFQAALTWYFGQKMQLLKSADVFGMAMGVTFLDGRKRAKSSGAQKFQATLHETKRT